MYFSISNREDLEVKGPLVSISLGLPTSKLVDKSLLLTENGVALLDTGAEHSAVDILTMQKLANAPIGHALRGGMGGHSTAPIYEVNFIFGDKIEAQLTGVFGLSLRDKSSASAAPFIAIIGRDILSAGMLVYNGRAGNFTLVLEQSEIPKSGKRALDDLIPLKE